LLSCVLEKQSKGFSCCNACTRIFVSPSTSYFNAQDLANINTSASCATIVRLKYLTLYSDPGEFIYATGKIGFWSLTEEGIGIIAGSLPALRPLLNLRVRITTSSNSAAASGNVYTPASHSRQIPSRAAMKMDTFQTLGDNDVDLSDGDSQKNIIKETRYTVTSTSVKGKESQEMGWGYNNSSRV
jgi:hypothetical protein